MTTLYASTLEQQDRVLLGRDGATDAALSALAASVSQGLYSGNGEGRFRDLGWDPGAVTLLQMAHGTPETPGSFGLAFEVAVHEAINAGWGDVVDLVAEAMADFGVRTSQPRSVLFGAERSARMGFMDALVTDLGERPVLRISATRRGAPYSLAKWLPTMAAGWRGEGHLPTDIAKVWKADLLLADTEGRAFVPATVKSNAQSLEGGPGLCVGIVPQQPGWPVGLRRDWKGLTVVVLPDDGTFLHMLDQAYATVLRVFNRLAGRFDGRRSLLIPSAKRLENELMSWDRYPVIEVIDVLRRRGQRGLVIARRMNVGVSDVHTIQLPALLDSELVELENGLLVPIAM